jgi:predicted DNA-binding transcriptional regulator AlpA
MGRRVDVDELADPSQVAELLGLTNSNGVSVYQRRYSDFPSPAISRGRCRLWLTSEIIAWVADHPRNAER